MWYGMAARYYLVMRRIEIGSSCLRLDRMSKVADGKVYMDTAQKIRAEGIRNWQNKGNGI